MFVGDFHLEALGRNFDQLWSGRNFYNVAGKVFMSGEASNQYLLPLEISDVSQFKNFEKYGVSAFKCTLRQPHIFKTC